MSKDYYEILGVKKGAELSEIKASYRQLAKKYHPDRNPDNQEAEKKFKEINAAYDVLKDDKKRAMYDQFGEEGANPGFGSQGGFSQQGGFDFSNGFSDIFEDLFSGGKSKRGGRNSAELRGSDIRYDITISLDEAYHGIKKEISFDAMSQCDTCGGTGSADGKEPEICGTCNGSGRTRVQQGFFAVERTCGTCNGTGTIIKNKCKKCKGEGRYNKHNKIAVTIPAGVEEGTRMRLSGKGEAGIRGGTAGDLYLFISVADHPFFIREENDIYCQVPIPMTTAILGGSIEVPTVSGAKAKITIPKGTQSSQKFRLKDKGMSILRSSSKGDMYVSVNVETPVNLNKKQLDLVESFAKISNEKSSPESEGFFKKVKGFFK